MNDVSSEMSRRRRRAELRRAAKQKRDRSLKAGAISLGVAALAGAADAATFTVTSPNDLGPGTLRQAVIDSNGAAGTDTINFDPGVTTVTLTSSEIHITDSVNITGPGAALLNITETADNRLFYIYNGSSTINVTISGVTMSNAGDPSIDGGAIYVVGETLNINDSVLSGNQGRNGGAIRLEGGTLVATRTDFTTNTAGYDGGAVDGGQSMVIVAATSVTATDSNFRYNYAGGDGGAISVFGNLVVEGSIFTSNDAYERGGAIRQSFFSASVDESQFLGNDGGDGGAIFFDDTITALVEDSNFADNSANYNSEGSGDGGAIFSNRATLEIRNTDFNDNYAYGYGGAFFLSNSYGNEDTLIDLSRFGGNNAYAGGAIAIRYNGSDLTIRETTISSNEAGSDGGGIWVRDTTGYGYTGYTDGTFTIERSTVSSNIATNGAGIFINSADGPALIENTTLAGNTASAEGGGLLIGTSGNDVTIEHTTIAGNSAAAGGGITNASATAATVNHSILADNTATLFPDANGLLTGTYNLVETGAGAITGANNIGGDPQLGPLQNNGGPTETQAIPNTSPAYNAGDPAFVPPPATDQRGTGFVRVAEGRIDIGAFELQAVGIPGQVQFSAAVTSVNEADGTVTITVTRTGGSDGAVSVDYATSGGTATSGVDFQPTNGTLNFADGDVSESFMVTINEDLLVEGDETFTATLSAPGGGATIGTPSTITVTIVDNDANVLAVPTLDDAAKIGLAVLIAIAALTALGKSRFTAAMVLLALGAAGAATSAQAAPARRDKNRVVITKVEQMGEQTILHLDNGKRVVVNTGQIKVRQGGTTARPAAERRAARKSAQIPVGTAVRMRVRDDNHGRRTVTIAPGDRHHKKGQGKIAATQLREKRKARQAAAQLRAAERVAERKARHSKDPVD